MADDIAVLDERLFERLCSLKDEQAEYTEFRHGKPLLAKIVEDVHLPLSSWYITRHTKSRNRVRDKVLKHMSGSSPLGLEEILDTIIKDYTGGRIIVHYISSLYVMYEHFKEEVEKRSDIKFDGDLEDCVREPRSTGWRGLKHVIEFETENSPATWFPFEVQFLTFLQHDWDQKQHPIYADPELVSSTIHDLYKKWAYELYRIDEQQDAIRGKRRAR